jgi:tetratricopeptide (TPR) repeat protein
MSGGKSNEVPSSDLALFAESTAELDADSALAHLLHDPESSDEQAELWRQQGNDYFRLGCRLLKEQENMKSKTGSGGQNQQPVDLRQRAHKLLHDALAAYSQALALPDCSASVREALFANRAEVHRRLGNYSRGLEDAQQCIQHGGERNLKAFYRAGACALALGRLEEALHYCRKGLDLVASSASSVERTALEHLRERISAQSQRQKQRDAAREALLQERLHDTQKLLATLERRRIRLGLPLFAQQKKLEAWQPKTADASDAALDIVDDTQAAAWTWPLMVVYPLAHQSDLIERVTEDSDLFALFSELLPMDGPPALSFDTDGMYRIDRVGFW